MIEIPNYWESLVAVRLEEPGNGHTGSQVRTQQEHLENECAEIIRTKLLIAINNAQGYGLDQLSSQDSNMLERTVAPQEYAPKTTETYDDEFLNNIPSLDSAIKAEWRPSPSTLSQSAIDRHEEEYYEDDDFES